MKKHMTKTRILSYLLLLTLASLLLVSVSYSRYTSNVSGTAAASVAVWSSQTSVPTSIDISGLTPGATKTYDFSITNTKDNRVSEVSQEYSVTVETTGNLPLTFALSPQDNIPSSVGTVIPEQNLTIGSEKVTASGGTLPHSVTETHTYRLTVTWPPDANLTVYKDEIDLVTLTVDAHQTAPVSQ